MAILSRKKIICYNQISRIHVINSKHRVQRDDILNVNFQSKEEVINKRMLGTNNSQLNIIKK